MTVSAATLAAEVEAYRKGGTATLAEAYRRLLGQWNLGDHDREVGLHLLFLAWYGLVEPTFITGFEANDTVSESLRRKFNEVYSEMERSLVSDPEFLYVVGLMAHLFPWALGKPEDWEQRGEEYRLRYRSLAPSGLDPASFADRGAYGLYFGSQAAVLGGY
jgi:hypothetical protein